MLQPIPMVSRRPWHRPVVGIGSRILVHALTVERAALLDSPAMSRLDCAESSRRNRATPRPGLTMRPLSGFRSAAPISLEEAAGIAVLIPIGPAEQLAHRELPEGQPTPSLYAGTKTRLVDQPLGWPLPEWTQWPAVQMPFLPIEAADGYISMPPLVEKQLADSAIGVGGVGREDLVLVERRRIRIPGGLRGIMAIGTIRDARRAAGQRASASGRRGGHPLDEFFHRCLR